MYCYFKCKTCVHIFKVAARGGKCALHRTMAAAVGSRLSRPLICAVPSTGTKDFVAVLKLTSPDLLIKEVVTSSSDSIGTFDYLERF